MESNHFERLFTNISGIHREILKLRLYFGDQLDIKAVQVFWIFLLKEHPEGMIASQLASASETNRSLVSREIKELVERNLVQYETKGKSQYAQKIVLTKQGMEVADKIEAITWDVQHQISRDISNKDLAVFYSVLEKLNHEFEAYNANIGEEK